MCIRDRSVGVLTDGPVASGVAVDAVAAVAEERHPHLAPEHELEGTDAAVEGALPGNEAAAGRDDAHLLQRLLVDEEDDRPGDQEISGDEPERNVDPGAEAVPGSDPRDAIAVSYTH